MKEKNTELNSRLYRFASSFFSKSLESRTANALVRHKSGGEGLISGSAETLDRKYLVPAKRAASSACEKSRILAFINGFLDEIMLMPVKTLGLIYFAAGVYILIKCILGRFISTFSTDSDYLTCGALCTVFAGTVMSSSRSVRSAISNSRICSAVAREVFGAVFEFEDEPKAIAGVFPAIITGLAMGELSFHTSFAFAVLLLPTILLLIVIFKIPESGITVLIAFLPFIPADYYPFAVIPVVLAVLAKIIQGKRSLKLGFSGFLIIIFCIFILVSGICGNLSGALRLIPVLLISLCVTALYKTGEWLGHGMKVLLFSCTIISAVAVLEKITLPFMGNSVVSFAVGTVSSVIGFDMSYSAVIAMIAAPFVASSIRGQADSDHRLIEAARLLVLIACTAFSGSGEIFVITVLGCVLAMLFTSRASLVYIIPASICAAILFMFFGREFMSYCGMTFRAPENVLGGLPVSNLIIGDYFDISSFRALYGNVSTFTLVTLTAGLSGTAILYVLAAVMFFNSLKSMIVSPYGNSMKAPLGGLTAGLTSLAVASVSADVAGNIGVVFAISVFLGFLTCAQRISDKNCEAFAELAAEEQYEAPETKKSKRRIR